MSNPSRNKPLIFIIAILLVANIVMLVYFLWLKPPPRAPRFDRSRDRLAESLKKDVGFNDSQLAQYKLLKDAQWDKMKARYEDLRKAKDNFFHLISSENNSDSALNAAGDSIALRQKALDIQAFYHFRELRKLCTPDQLPKYDTLVQRLFHRLTGPFLRSGTARSDSTPKN